MNRWTSKIQLSSWRDRIWVAFLLQILTPGLGHMYVREYMFGTFVLLVMLLAAVLSVALFFIDISRGGAVLLLSIPAIFYLFSFADLKKHVRGKPGPGVSSARIWLFISIGIIYQCFAPSSPLNAIWKNRPVFIRTTDSVAPPTIRKEEWLTVNRSAYVLRLSYLPAPLLHHAPDRYEFVYFEAKSGRREIGMVLGYPLEQIEITNSTLLVDGVAEFSPIPDGVELSGEWPLTFVDDDSMLLATFHLGRIDRLEMVPVTHLIGRIRSYPR